MWADNFWVISHSKEHLEQVLMYLIGEAGPNQRVCGDKHVCFRRKELHDFGHHKRLLQISLCRQIQGTGLCYESSRENVQY